MRNGEKGFILVFALVIIMLVVLSLTALFLVSYNDLAMSYTITRGMRAYYIAEAGLAKRFMDLRGEDPPRTGTSSAQNFKLVGGDSGSYVTRTTQIAGGSLATYRIDSVGRYRNVTRRVSLTVRQRSFSSFSYLTNVESQKFGWGTRLVWFKTGDRLTGPVYTNDQFNIYGDPLFEGPVSSASAALNHYHGGSSRDNPEFGTSLTLGVPAIQMPSAKNTMVPIINSVQSGYSYPGDTRITFLSNGTMNVYNYILYGPYIVNRPLPPNGVIYVFSGVANVSGTLSGKVTLGCNGNICIIGNILYNSDPRDNPESPDMLGLVAGGNVIISPGSPDDLEIDAYIVAVNGSFKVDDYVINNCVMKGTLNLCGGISQSNRGAMGAFYSMSGQKGSGYTKNYEYDARLLNTAPVCFPAARDVNNRILYRKIAWSES